MVYSQLSIVKNRLYSEAKRIFNKVEDYDRFITILQRQFAGKIPQEVNRDTHSGGVWCIRQSPNMLQLCSNVAFSDQTRS